MITYAVSMSSVGGIVSPLVASAFRRSRIHQVELNFAPYTSDNAEGAESAELTRQLIRERSIQVASVHLPFYGGGKCWDPSAVDEEQRKCAVENLKWIINTYPDLFGQEATLHASSIEPPMEEHAIRLRQVCQSLEELVPLCDKIGFRINVEYLPRTCVGNSAEELENIISQFPCERVGICLDVNHLMGHSKDLPDVISRLSSRINTFHINDYDGIDELHWFAGQGVLDWCKIMERIRAMTHDVILISETKCMLSEHFLDHAVDPWWALKQTEDSIWLLENCDTLLPSRRKFHIPGN